jgi:serine/threonine-protein kinase
VLDTLEFAQRQTTHRQQPRALKATDSNVYNCTTMALQPGSRLGAYEVEDLLGSGGMGRVYRARDPRLTRPVAIKVLADEISADSDRLNRFRDEARAAASLNHQHICGVYEVEHDLGVAFIVMELVEGRPLSDVISRSGLRVSAVVRYGAQIADALSHAHARGIVHGDLKARNVMIADTGEAKIVDFGLARRLRADDAATDTQTEARIDSGGGITGTPAYMAPETLRGNEADQRSDIWALGVLLHEMVTGTLPFQGRTLAELSSSVLRDAPQPLPPDVPAGFSAVVRRCLAKEPIDRYQSAAEIRSALETIGTGAAREAGPPTVRSSRRWLAAALGLLVVVTAGSFAAYRLSFRPPDAAPSATTLAVLPCRALAERERISFLEVGIADSIIIALSNAAQLRVRSTPAILQYERRDVDPREVGTSLGVEYLLTCTLQPTPDRVAATVQLVRTSDGSTVWGDRSDVARSDLLGLRDQISERVASALRVRMTETERERFYRRYTNNAEAYERYLKGRAALVRYTRDGTLRAIDEFRRALGIDSQYALAHAGLASAAAQMRIRFAPEKDLKQWLDLAIHEADEALRLDAGLAEAHEARAAVARNTEFDWDRTMKESDLALALNPSLALPHFYRAGAFYHYGLFEESARAIQLGTANDPVNRVEPLRLLGTAALLDGRAVDARTHLTEAQRLTESAVMGSYLALALYYEGKTSEAEALLDAVRGSAQAERRAQAALAGFLAARGDRQRAKALIDTVTGSTYMDHHVAYSLGAAHAQLGDAAEAFRWLERAKSEGFPCMAWFARDPLLAPIRSDPRYQPLITDLEAMVRDFRAKHGVR